MKSILKKIWFPAVIVVAFICVSWLVLNNYKLVNELRSEGKQPVSITTPSQDGKDGKNAYQLWLEQGNEGSIADFLATLRGSDGRSLQGRDGRDGIDGKDGVDGRDGKNGLDSTIPGMEGRAGKDGRPGRDSTVPGPKGDKGESGAAGRSPVLACVVRNLNGLPTRFVAWKYADAANSTYQDLYKLPAWAECSAPIDLT